MKCSLMLYTLHNILRVVNLDAIQPKVIHKILRVVNLDAIQPKVIHKIH